jgi:hypothetical protein
MAETSFSLAEVSAAIAREGLNWQAAENELTAMADEDRRRYLGLVVTPEERARLVAECQTRAAVERQTLATRFAAPASFDWRSVNGANYVTPVKNQGNCGSCVSFGTCAVIESAVRIKLQNPGSRRRFVRGVHAVLRRRQLQRLGSHLRTCIRQEHRRHRRSMHAVPAAKHELPGEPLQRLAKPSDKNQGLHSPQHDGSP